MYYCNIVFETDRGSIFYMFCVAFCWYRNKRSQRTVPTNQVSEFNFTAATGDCNVLYNRLKIKWIREKMWCTRDFSKEKKLFCSLYALMKTLHLLTFVNIYGMHLVLLTSQMTLRWSYMSWWGLWRPLPNMVLSRTS